MIKVEIKPKIAKVRKPSQEYDIHTKTFNSNIFIWIVYFFSVINSVLRRLIVLVSS